jgi:hypothetical protein
MTNVDSDFLAPPGFDLMYVGDCDADSAKYICRRLADLETRRIDRIVSVNRYFAIRRHAAAAYIHNFFESRVHSFVL